MFFIPKDKSLISKENIIEIETEGQDFNEILSKYYILRIELNEEDLIEISNNGNSQSYKEMGQITSEKEEQKELVEKTQEALNFFTLERKKYEEALLKDGNFVKIFISKEYLAKLRVKENNSRVEGCISIEGIVGAKNLEDLESGKGKKYKFTSTNIFLNYLVWILGGIYENNNSIFERYEILTESAKSIESLNLILENFKQIPKKECIENEDFNLYSMSSEQLKNYCDGTSIISNTFINLDNFARHLKEKFVNGVLTSEGFDAFAIDEFDYWWQNIVLPSYNPEDGHYYVLKEYTL